MQPTTLYTMHTPTPERNAALTGAVDDSAVSDAHCAVRVSVSENRIVRIDDATAAHHDALIVLCEGSVDTDDETEFWGVTEDGDEWRVHCPREARP